jgi:phosphoglycolate phosphatase
MTTMPETTFIPDTQIEIINPAIERGKSKHVLFDFDGTLSLIREGWQDVMIPMCTEFILETGTDEPEEDIHLLVKEYVTRLTGKQTIYQMIQLAEEIKKRGKEPKEPLEYKHIYLDRLWERINYRVNGLKSGELNKEDFVVPGSYQLMDSLEARGMINYLASGTDLPYVEDECQTLDLTKYFGEHVYGALDDYKNFSKKMVIQKIFHDFQLSGPELLTFGDGYVEIEDSKALGGIAVGVASDEAGKVNVDEWKRNRLIEAGADIIIPHYKDCDVLMAFLFEKE